MVRQLVDQPERCTQHVPRAQRVLRSPFDFDPQVILLDIALPDFSGYDVAREVRARLCESVDIAAVTGWGRDEDVARAVVAGFDQHVTKPANREHLEAIMSAAAARDRARSSR